MGDLGTTPPAGCPAAAVDLMAVLEGALPTPSIAVVPKGAAASVDRPLEGVADRLGEAVDPTCGEVAGRFDRMDPRREQGLVCVDVADAGDQPLVHQGGLDRSAGASKRPMQARAVDRAGIRAKRRPQGALKRGEVGGAPHSTKAPWVDEAQRDASTVRGPKRPAQVLVGVGRQTPRPLERLRPEASGHPQMHADGTAGRLDRELLAMAVQGDNGAAPEQRCGDRPTGAPHDVAPPALHQKHLATNQKWGDRAADRLDFGQFRHGGRLRGGSAADVAGAGGTILSPASEAV